MKEQEALIKWVNRMEKGLDDEQCWSELGDELTSILKPIRKKIINNKEDMEKIEKQAKAVEEKINFYMEAIDSLPNPIFIKDHQTKFVFFNKQYEEAFGISRDGFIGKRVFDLEFLPQDERDKYQCQDEKMLECEGVVNYEASFVFDDGNLHDSLYWSKGFSVSGTGQKGLIGEIVDISKQKALEKELSINLEKLQEANAIITEASQTDSVTGLYNRYVLDSKVSSLFSRGEYCHTGACVLLADLDFFKVVNDTYGHLVGDEVLIAFARILKESCRQEDICIRYGGEEFLVILPETRLPGACVVGNRICDNLRKNAILPDGKYVTVSIGVTEYRYNESLEQCLFRVDEALYTAKKLGKDQVVVLS